MNQHDILALVEIMAQVTGAPTSVCLDDLKALSSSSVENPFSIKNTVKSEWSPP